MNQEISTGSVEEYARDCFHKSRLETGLETLDEPDYVEFEGRKVDFCEDFVNVYLVDILTSFAKPSHQARIAGFLSDYDTDLIQRIEASPRDTRQKFELYKANADTLLLVGGIFDPRGEREEETNKARHYYSFAASYLRNLRMGQLTPNVLTLKKISGGFDRYIRILRHMAKHHFHITPMFNEGELLEFSRDIEYDCTMDQFLEACSQWKSTKDDSVKQRAIDLAARLTELNPDLDTEKLFNPLNS